MPSHSPSTVRERLLSKMVITDSGCWEWQGCRHPKSGRGKIRVKGRVVYAPRASYEEFHGQPIPEGLCVLHSCDNPPCINPEHLSIGTQLENIQDRDAKGRQAVGSTNARTRLSDDDVRRIRAASAVPRRVLAQRFGVAPNTISRIRCRSRRQHTEDNVNDARTTA